MSWHMIRETLKVFAQFITTVVLIIIVPLLVFNWFDPLYYAYAKILKFDVRKDRMTNILKLCLHGVIVVIVSTIITGGLAGVLFGVVYNITNL